MTCSISGCAGRVIARGWCTKHYQRWKVYGDPNHPGVGRGKPQSVFPGERYGRLVVLRKVASIAPPHSCYEVQCDCGNVTVVRGYGMTNGNTMSCGCLHRETFTNRTHGQTGSPTHVAWKNMLRRVRAKPGTPDYSVYVLRGITVCDRWDPKKGGSFANFLSDMGERPEGPLRMSIDRIDATGNYEPGNCRWVELSENSARAHRGIGHIGGNYHRTLPN